MMIHKRFQGIASMDDEAEVLRGEVIGVADTITFQGRGHDEVKQAFVDAVEDYLEFCASCGKPADKPFSRTMTLRIGPEVHKVLSATAKIQGLSLNKLASQVLGNYAATREPPISLPTGAPTGSQVGSQVGGKAMSVVPSDGGGVTDPEPTRMKRSLRPQSGRSSVPRGSAWPRALSATV